LHLAGARSAAARYFGALSVVVLLTVLRILLVPVLGLVYPFHGYWMAVALVAYWWGPGPGVVATLLGLVGARFFFIEPLYSLSFSDSTYVLRCFVFLFYCLGIIMITGALRKARTRAEQARRQAEAAEQRSNRILHSIGDGFLVADGDYRIVHVNPRAVEISRRNGQQLRGVSLWDVFPELKGGNIAAALRETVEQKRQSHFEDFQPGADLWLEGDTYPSEEGVTIFFRDITGRKKTELELQRRSEQLQRSNAELQQFAYAAAHDLQEPLRTITTLSKNLNEKHLPVLPPEGRESLDSIAHSTARMQHMISDLLAYSWAVSKADPAIEEVDTRAVAEMALLNCQSAIDESKAVVSLGDLPRVPGTAQQLLLVFQNLLSNAIKYRGPEQLRIAIYAKEEGNDWVFTVEDNGIGLDMQFAERIFGVFRRLHGPEIPGTGIGLALCKRIVENYGGRIWVESELGKGAKFHFALRKLSA
jgi:PAS domain S-box-containing protein